MQEWKMIVLALLSNAVDEIKMYGGIFFCSNPLGTYEQSEFGDQHRKIRMQANTKENKFVNKSW